MKNCKGRIFASTLATLFLWGMVAPHGSSGAPKKYLSLGTGNPRGTYYVIGAGFANIFNKYVPEVRVIAESTAASEENFHYLSLDTQLPSQYTHNTQKRVLINNNL